MHSRKRSVDKATYTPFEFVTNIPMEDCAFLLKDLERGGCTQILFGSISVDVQSENDGSYQFYVQFEPQQQAYPFASGRLSSEAEASTLVKGAVQGIPPFALIFRGALIVVLLVMLVGPAYSATSTLPAFILIMALFVMVAERYERYKQTSALARFLRNFLCSPRVKENLAWRRAAAERTKKKRKPKRTKAE